MSKIDKDSVINAIKMYCLGGEDRIIELINNLPTVESEIKKNCNTCLQNANYCKHDPTTCEAWSPLKKLLDTKEVKTLPDKINLMYIEMEDDMSDITKKINEIIDYIGE